MINELFSYRIKPRPVLCSALAAQGMSALGRILHAFYANQNIVKLGTCTHARTHTCIHTHRSQRADPTDKLDHRFYLPDSDHRVCVYLCVCTLVPVFERACFVCVTDVGTHPHLVQSQHQLMLLSSVIAVFVM